MNICNIEKAFKMKAERKWETLYVMVDAHGTIVRPYHERLEMYPECIEVLQWFTNRKDFKLILWSSSFMRELEEIDSLALQNGIVFNYINQNPLEKSTKIADFTAKFYFNILIDDKSGFSPEDGDWLLMGKELERITGDKIIDWNKEKIKKLKISILNSIRNFQFPS
jgi:hypothetical protein